MQVHQHYSLKKYNTFGIEAIAGYFATFSAMEDLQTLLEDYRHSSKMILGGGSNILFTKDFDGIILKNEIPGIQITGEDHDFVYINAGAGVKWHSFVMFCVNRNLGGVENLSLIPGNVGAAPMQNIGAYGVEIKDVFYELESLHLHEKVTQRFSVTECEFGYRESVFKKKYKDQFVILNVTCRLKKDPLFNISYGAIEAELQKMDIEKITVRSISDAVVRIRTSKLPDPATIGNAGSFFKNPVVGKQQLLQIEKLQLLQHGMPHAEIPFYKMNEDYYKIPAGWLIEQCGWKGFRKNDAGCYERQALVLVNYGNATGKEIYSLSEEIKISVKEKYGIELEREVNIV